MDIQRDELVLLFQLLSQREQDLDVPLLKLKTRIEKQLYTFMTIEEIEVLLDNGGVKE